VVTGSLFTMCSGCVLGDALALSSLLALVPAGHAQCIFSEQPNTGQCIATYSIVTAAMTTIVALRMRGWTRWTIVALITIASVTFHSLVIKASAYATLSAWSTLIVMLCWYTSNVWLCTMTDGIVSAAILITCMVLLLSNHIMQGDSEIVRAVFLVFGNVSGQILRWFPRVRDRVPREGVLAFTPLKHEGCGYKLLFVSILLLSGIAYATEHPWLCGWFMALAHFSVYALALFQAIDDAEKREEDNLGVRDVEQRTSGILRLFTPRSTVQPETVAVETGAETESAEEWLGAGPDGPRNPDITPYQGEMLTSVQPSGNISALFRIVESFPQRSKN
jgi:hypothetical protein